MPFVRPRHNFLVTPSRRGSVELVGPPEASGDHPTILTSFELLTRCRVRCPLRDQVGLSMFWNLSVNARKAFSMFHDSITV